MTWALRNNNGDGDAEGAILEARRMDEVGGRPHLACMNCVSCCDPAPLSEGARREASERWAHEMRAHEESLRKGQERYVRATGGTPLCDLTNAKKRGGASPSPSSSSSPLPAVADVFSNNVRSCNRRLSLILPLIVMRRDGTLVQYDPPSSWSEEEDEAGERDDEEAGDSESSDSEAPTLRKPKVALSGLYRECFDSVSHVSARARRSRSHMEKDDLVRILGLLCLERSALRNKRGLKPLSTLLLPLKMTNVSITAKVEEAEEDFVRAERRNAADAVARERAAIAAPTGAPRSFNKPPRTPLHHPPRPPTMPSRGRALLKDEFSESVMSIREDIGDFFSLRTLRRGPRTSSSSSSSSSSQQEEGKRSAGHSRSWSWDSCFSASGFKDFPLHQPSEADVLHTPTLGGDSASSASASTSASSLGSLRERSPASSSLPKSIANVCSLVNNGIRDKIKRCVIKQA